ncbi:RagB/SusD family nutrient uptake outer membrane protein [Belliella marina]|uniref:RagB/SusD family nutrient uptake outer membrane protein n=1 Tax=Belliella marina TaxID=1644146 RepID=A0ABW4VKF1_9BACT
MTFNIKIQNSILTLAIVLLICSCDKEFLGRPISNDVTVEEIFSERARAESFLWETYRTNVPLGFPIDWGKHNGMYASMLMAASDEGDVYDSWPSSNDHNTGVWSAVDNRENDFGVHYKGIRNAWIFIENVDVVPDIPNAEKEQMKAEAKVLMAISYHELMKRYGAVPLVREVLSASGEIMLPRNTYEECVEYIVELCNQGIEILPNNYSTQFLGRVTKGVAHALKSRVLLYAASPLHNTDTPYLPGQEQLTGYGNYSINRWQTAANASREMLDWASQNGYSLVESSTDPQTNYSLAIETQGNSEVILMNQSNGWWGAYGPMFQQFAMPRGIYGGWYGHGVTLNHANNYHTIDGEDLEWPETGSLETFRSNMESLEPRFQYSVFYSGSRWNDEIGTRDFFQRSDGTWSDNAPVNGVGYMKKFLGRGNWGGGQFHWIIFRLGEIYLNYAEALNEASPLDPAAFDAINRIKRRAGIPEIDPSDPRYNTQEKFRAEIRRERAIELAFEEHRFFDVRRWRIASEEGVMKGQMWGLTLYQQTDGSMIFRKEPFESRVWEDRMYIYPIPQGEIDKGYIQQNPGW